MENCILEHNFSGAHSECLKPFLMNNSLNQMQPCILYYINHLFFLLQVLIAVVGICFVDFIVTLTSTTVLMIIKQKLQQK